MSGTHRAPLPRGTRILSIGLHPRTLDYGRMPEGVDEAGFTTRIEAVNTALRASGFTVVPCLVDASPEAAERTVRALLAADDFGLAMIGGGVRMMPEHTVLFERLVNVLVEAAPGIRFCFTTSPENTVEVLGRWVRR
ncbi:hypothetical protein ACSMX9_21390 [Streptomyces sp. LE64]|uniref:hypothetical protein n=1 Tax=Streptomyces sp. LE64 TaxID=3448653 RepID=UPI004041A4C6